MRKPKPEAAALLHRNGQRIDARLGSERNRHNGNIRQSVQPDDCAQNRSRIACRLKCVDLPMTSRSREQLRVLSGVRPDIENDAIRRYQLADRRGERAVMLLGCRLPQVSDKTARYTPAIGICLHRPPRMRQLIGYIIERLVSITELAILQRQKA